ncbi:MAG: mannosyltransferase family protein, partial [Ktedonobacterales bacterium]
QYDVWSRTVADAAPPGAPVEGAKLPVTGLDTAGTEPVRGAARRLPREWRRVARQAALMWLGTRVAFALLTYFALLFATSGPHKPGPPQTGFISIAPHFLLSAWERWDAVPFLFIAQHGYTTAGNGAFFPLYPLLTGAVTLVVGSAHALLAAMVVSNLGALAAFIGLALLAASESNPSKEGPSDSVEPFAALRIFAAYPFAFLLVAPYADGVFLGLAFFALYCLRGRLWRWAALCVFLATLTQPTGLILVAPLVWEYWKERGGGVRVRRGTAAGNAALVALAGPAALLLFAGYLAVRFGQPLAFIQSRSLYWQYTRDPIWTALPFGTTSYLVVPGWSYGQLVTVTSVVLLVGVAVVTAVVWQRMPGSFRLYMVGLLAACGVALVVAPDAFRSPGPMLLAAVPIFLVLGRASRRRPSVDMLLVGCGFLIQAALALVWLAGLSPV